MLFSQPKEAKRRHGFHRVYDEIWEFWTSPTGAFILAVTALALGYYQFYVSRPILRYETKAMKLISDANDNAYEVDIHGKKYKNLYLTKVYLYNIGDAALSGGDVSQIGHDPIRITIPKEAALQHFNLDNDETSSAITAEVVPYGEDLILNFDFLNPNYQYVVNLLHEAPTDKIEVTGSALNVNAISKVQSDKELKNWFLWGLSVLYLLLIIRYITKKLLQN
jgi:hypothetical protein